ncbi:MAG: hypothetical protein ACRDJ9_21090, partial [Dehalococcoidia bacterium]
ETGERIKTGLHWISSKWYGPWVDTGDAWNFDEVALARLFAMLFANRDRVVLLSGDIHFGYAVRLDYWARRHFESTTAAAQPTSHVLAQLTSSALKNADALNGPLVWALESKAKIILQEGQEWAGWNEWPGLLRRAGLLRRDYREPLPDRPPVVRRVSSDDFAVTGPQHQPDWRYRMDLMRREPAPGFTPPPWFQAGPEIVGMHNVGIISFEWPGDDAGKAVIQDLYWWPLEAVLPYNASRYLVGLDLQPPPPDLPIRPAP